ncbi:MAG: hypothetical protein RPU32_01260 [Candidatus Sedimenticola sp. (ex Thyasira tokunagai)]
MNQLNNSCAYYSLLSDALSAAQEEFTRFQAGRDTQLSLIYVDAEPPEGGPINLIHAPFAQLPDLFLQTTLPLPEVFSPGNRNLPEAVLEHEKSRFFTTIDQIRKVREQHLLSEQGNLLALDTLFLHRNLAYATALQRNRVDLGHPNIYGLQVCYYEGEAFENSPENLINITSVDLVTFFTETRLRVPAHLVIPPGVPEQDKKELHGAFKQLRQTVLENRDALGREFTLKCHTQKPPLIEPERPLRIYLPASRLTEVMQYASKGLAKAFTALGHEAWVSIEVNAMEQLDYQHPQEQYAFNPHLMVNINHTNNQWMHPELFNVVWWQDPMPEITTGNQINWRERDIVFSAYQGFDKLLHHSGAKEIHRQGFCIDRDIFIPLADIKRKRKAVFIGSSYKRMIGHLQANEKKLLDKYEEILVAGEPIHNDSFLRTKKELGIAEHRVPRLLNYIVRDNTVRWLCEAPDIEVEIYGRGWEYDPVIKPFFKGEVEHGEDVAKIYNGAKYALVALPHEVNSQRLAEAAACGCIPVVWDCRYHAEPPFWENECLFFSTRNELYRCLHETARNPPNAIANTFSYGHMAAHILEIVGQKQNNGVSARRSS